MEDRADPSTARERRRMHHEKNRKRLDLSQIRWGKAVAPVLVVLAIGLAAGMPFVYQNYMVDKGCPGHWHATFRVFDDGEELGFKHPRFDMKHMTMSTHLHQPNDAKMHLEGGCATVADFFDEMGIRLQQDSLRLDQELHDGRTITNDGNMTWRFFATDEAGNWTEKPKLPSYQPKDGQRMLLTFGDLTDEEIAAQQRRVPDPSA